MGKDCIAFYYVWKHQNSNVCNQIQKLPTSHRTTSRIDALQMAAEKSLNTFIKLAKKMLKALVWTCIEEI